LHELFHHLEAEEVIEMDETFEEKATDLFAKMTLKIASA